MTTFFEALAEQTEMGWTAEQARAAFASALQLRELGQRIAPCGARGQRAPVRQCSTAPKREGIAA